MNTQHGDPNCPLCEIELRLRASNDTWEKLLAKVKPINRLTHLQGLTTMQMAFSDAGMFMPVKPLLRNMAKARDRVKSAMHPSFSYEEAIEQTFGKRVDDALPTINKMSACGDTADHIQHLFFGTEKAPEQISAGAFLEGKIPGVVLMLLPGRGRTAA